MTVVDALAILEAATLECRQRDIYTPEVEKALDFLQPHISTRMVDSAVALSCTAERKTRDRSR